MLTEQQIELVNSKTHIFEPCLNFASKYLILPDIEIAFDDCPSQRFLSMNNAAESWIGDDGVGRICLNAPWFVERIDEHQDDVEFFFFHELRHLHQKIQIQAMQKGQKTREPIKTVKIWEYNFNNYQRNEDENSQKINVTQEVEIDANAYGILLEIFYRKGKKPLLSLPAEAFDPANERLQIYYDTLPEFKQLRY